MTHENLEEDDDECEEREGSEENYLNLIEYEELIRNKAEYVLNCDSMYSKSEAYSWLKSILGLYCHNTIEI